MFKQIGGSCDNLTGLFMENWTFSDCSLQPQAQTFPPLLHKKRLEAFPPDKMTSLPTSLGCNEGSI